MNKLTTFLIFSVFSISAFSGELPLCLLHKITPRNHRILDIGNYPKPQINNTPSLFRSNYYLDKNNSKINLLNINSIQRDWDLTAGDYLVRAKNRFLTSLILGMAGGIIKGTGSILYSNGKISDMKFLGYSAVGAAATFTGFCFGISAWIQIGNAGRQLNLD